MTINDNCIREILRYLVENLKIHIKNMKFTYVSISVSELINKLESQRYSKEDIVYSINILASLHYIEGEQLTDKMSVNFAYQKIDNVTYRGQQFYESIKPEPIWNKTKHIVEKVGVHTLEFIESVAHDAAVESAKEATKMLLNPNNP